MSGSGGFYKYRCKYFMTHDCPNWVFVNYAPCADCCAAGRDADEMNDDGFYHNHHSVYAAAPKFEIGVPIFQDGILRYTLAGVTSRLEPGADFAMWTTHGSPMTAFLPQQGQQGPDPGLPHPGQQPQPIVQQLHMLPQQQPQALQFQHQPPPPQHLVKLQGSSPGRQAAHMKMQLPPHAASRAFPEAMTIGGAGDMIPAGVQGVIMF
ncbi:hypothetical protein Sste5346_008132 [Sporothrix stenoceras]|uniref:Uncharacterized protein n=1 Tax=Sporothrix stenoceras TaxID=5173 RepID=A0ABR3YQI7_9PEZI